MSAYSASPPVTANTTVVTRVRPRYWYKNGRLTYELLEIRPSGEGRLLAHLEQLKRMLQAEGLWSQAALPALLLVLVGLVPVVALMFERR